MSWQRIAVLDGRRLLRSRGLWIATVIFGTVLAIGTAIPWIVLDEPSASTGAAYLLGPAVDVGIPALAIILTYASIGGLRRDGRIKVLLATPIARHHIVSGIILARLVCLWCISLIGLLMGILTIILLYGVPPAGPVLLFIAVTFLAGASYTVIGVTVSTVFGRPIRSIGVLLIGFLFAHSLWAPLVRGLTQYVWEVESGRWVDALILVSPLEAYTTLADGFLPASPHLDVAVEEDGISADAGDLVGGSIASGDVLVALAVLVAWMAGGIIIARLAFHRCEIE